MIPTLLDIGILRIPTFGVFLMLAFFWASFLVWKNTLLTSYKEVDIFDCLNSGIIMGVLGGRLVHVLIHAEEFGWSISRFILINGYPGIHLTGFLLGLFSGFALCAKYKRIPFSKYMDYLVTPLLLALGIGKLGSFFSGAEIGSQTDFLLSLRYRNLDGARHLTAFYESLFFFLCTYISYRILMALRKGNVTSGMNVVFFVILYGAITLATDVLKTSRVFTYGISIDIIISAILLLTAGIFLIYHFRTKLFSAIYKRR